MFNICRPQRTLPTIAVFKILLPTPHQPQDSSLNTSLCSSILQPQPRPRPQQQAVDFMRRRQQSNRRCHGQGQETILMLHLETFLIILRGITLLILMPTCPLQVKSKKSVILSRMHRKGGWNWIFYWIQGVNKGA